MITENQAQRLAEAGLYAYNHNLDSSEEYYKEVISTRGYQDRLDTIDNVRKTNVTVCSGGIIGMGENIEDRAGMLVALSTLNPQPESVPINALVAVEGTPLRRAKTGFYLGYDSYGSYYKNCNARNASTFKCWKKRNESRRTSNVFLCRSKFYFCRR